MAVLVVDQEERDAEEEGHELRPRRSVVEERVLGRIVRNTPVTKVRIRPTNWLVTSF